MYGTTMLGTWLYVSCVVCYVLCAMSHCVCIHILSLKYVSFSLSFFFFFIFFCITFIGIHTLSHMQRQSKKKNKKGIQNAKHCVYKPANKGLSLYAQPIKDSKNRFCLNWNPNENKKFGPIFF